MPGVVVLFAQRFEVGSGFFNVVDREDVTEVF
jgi:hypothetical protein